MEKESSCEDFFESLKSMFVERNMSYKHLPYPGGSDMELWKTPDISGYIKILAYVVIILGGLLGNLSVVLTVALVKSIRTTINFYVANLAVADAMICIVCMLPQTLSVYTGDKFVLGEFWCKFNTFIQMTCLISSVLTLCAISADRFMAVFRPLQVRTTKKRINVILIVIWIISLAVSLPFIFVKQHIVIEWADFVEPYCAEAWPISYYRDKKTNKCQIEEYIRKVYYVFLFVTLFAVPVIIMFLAYSKILYKLWTSRVPGERSEANIQAQSRSKQKVLKMVIVVLIVFVICWTPMQVTIYISAFGLDLGESKILPKWYPEFKWFAYYIAYANSFMNPFIYGQYNKDFRDGFCFILHCGNRNKRCTCYCGPTSFFKSVRSMSTTLSSLRSGTHTSLSKSKSKDKETEIQATAV